MHPAVPGAAQAPGGVPPTGAGPRAPATWGGTPPGKRTGGRQLSLGIASIVAAAALVVGGSAGFVIGHSSSSSQTPPGMGQLDGGAPPGLGTGSGQGQTQSS
ncbi:hypothetical protein [Amycolatopsis methanolica]|uniref:hypothetical protein n=1 Tax=Amycolatopsis methanolica TaxID=1814 RepID=UPI000367138C|nr:hypothetical protein [Amycolatopsis methanolica]